MRKREKEIPFIYIDTKEVVISFLHSLLPTKNCYLIFKNAKLSDDSLSRDQNEAFRRVYRDIVNTLVPTDPGF